MDNHYKCLCARIDFGAIKFYMSALEPVKTAEERAVSIAKRKRLLPRLMSFMFIMAKKHMPSSKGKTRMGQSRSFGFQTKRARSLREKHLPE